MFEKRIKSYNNIIKCLDLLVIYFALNAAELISSTYLGRYTVNGTAAVIPNVVLFFIMAAAFFFCHNLVAGFYYLKSPHSYRNILKIGAPQIAIVALGDAGLLFLSGFWAPLKAVGLCFILIYVGFYYVFNLAGWLLTYSYFREMKASEKNIRNVLIVGSNTRARQVSDYLQANPLLGYHLLGYIDDHEDAQAKVDHLGTLKDFGSSLFHVGGKCLHSGLKALKKVHYERD